MDSTIQSIPLSHLAIAALPVLGVLLVYIKWSLKTTNVIYALGRMLIQLLIIGYFLAFIFETRHAWVIVLILLVMVFASSWIALGTVADKRQSLFTASILSTLLGGGLILAIVTQLVLQLDPWYRPQFMIPLAGMVFANAMNSISLSAERLNAEISRGVHFEEARSTAFQAAMIPIINSLFAVGLVSLPGMMTGQILSGVSPLIAARYQIMVMLMIFISGGISTAIFLTMVKEKFSSPLRPDL